MFNAITISRMILNWNFELRILSVYGQFDVQENFQGFWLKKCI